MSYLQKSSKFIVLTSKYSCKCEDTRAKRVMIIRHSLNKFRQYRGQSEQVSIGKLDLHTIY